MNNQLRTKILWTGLALASGESAEVVIDLNTQLPNGFFSLQLGITGAGTAAIDYSVSNTGVTYIPGDSVIGNDEDSDWSGLTGDQIVAFYPVPCRYLKITVTASGAITASATLCVQ